MDTKKLDETNRIIIEFLPPCSKKRADCYSKDEFDCVYTVVGQNDLIKEVLSLKNVIPVYENTVPKYRFYCYRPTDAKFKEWMTGKAEIMVILENWRKCSSLHFEMNLSPSHPEPF